jgi:flagellar operon protein
VSVDPIRRIDPAGSEALQRASRATGDAVPFDRVLADRLAARAEPGQSLRFSGHALDRVRQRGIDLDGDRLTRLEEGVARAAAKGGRDSLVLVDGTAFVVSVSNRTVVTAVDQEHMREQVFTNIDSAVIA